MEVRLGVTLEMSRFDFSELVEVLEVVEGVLSCEKGGGDWFLSMDRFGELDRERVLSVVRDILVKAESFY